jgi:DNA-binding NtrC family response regulator
MILSGQAMIDQNRHDTSVIAAADPNAPGAFVVDDEKGICLFVGKTLEKLGFAVATFNSAKDVLAALDRQAPKIIFLDIALKQSDAIDVIKGLGGRHYAGIIQLMSGNPRLLEAIQRVALRDRLNIRPPLAKPFGGEAIRGVIAAAGIEGAVAAAR